MIQLSKNSSTFRFSPISRPSEVPTIITITKLLENPQQRLADDHVRGRIAVDLDDALNQHQRPRQHCGQRQQREAFPCENGHTARVINPGDIQLSVRFTPTIRALIRG